MSKQANHIARMIAYRSQVRDNVGDSEGRRQHTILHSRYSVMLSVESSARYGNIHTANNLVDDGVSV